jgi:uncharacterized protein YjiS (DUF1127 family)
MEQLYTSQRLKMTITYTLSESIFVKFYNSIQNFMTQVSNRRAKVKLVKKTVKQLNGLTDRELRDIGLSRYDIEMVAKEYMDELNSK